MSPLRGVSVVITRTRAQNEPLRMLLEQRGAEVVELPLIEVVDASDGGAALERAVSNVAEFDWLVVTSPNGAERVARLLSADERRPMVAVVGDATARALGCEATLTADPATAAALAEQFPDGAGSVLLVQGDLADDTLHRSLTAKGWRVTRVEAYRTTATRPSSDVIETATRADVVLFASGSAVRSWHDCVGVAPRCTVVIGPSTADVARSIGFEVAEVAAPHSLEGLVEAAERAVLVH